MNWHHADPIDDGMPATMARSYAGQSGRISV